MFMNSTAKLELRICKSEQSRRLISIFEINANFKNGIFLHYLKFVYPKTHHRILDEEQHKMSESTKAGYGWKQYYNLSDIYDWLDQMLDKYPHLLTHYNYGNSYEGRPLRAIKVSHEKVKKCSANVHVLLQK